MTDLIQILAQLAIIIALGASMLAVGFKLGYHAGFKDGRHHSNSFNNLKKTEALRSFHGRNRL